MRWWSSVSSMSEELAELKSNVQSNWRAACGTSKRLQGAV
jgi:hypothetical protein